MCHNAAGYDGRPTGANPAPADGADLPEDVLALLDHHLRDLGGTYGDPEAGDPIRYDELRIEHDQGDVEIVVYNRVNDRVKWAPKSSRKIPPSRVKDVEFR